METSLRNVRYAVEILERAADALKRGKLDLALAEISNARHTLVFLAHYLTLIETNEERHSRVRSEP
jgi:hypothetical protein